MGKSDHILRAAIDDAVSGLEKDNYALLADAVATSLMASRANLHYMSDQYGTQMLDFSNINQPAGHHHPFVVSAIREHLDYYIDVGTEAIQRWPVEYAKNLIMTFAEDTASVPDLQVLFTSGEREAMSCAIDLANIDRKRDDLLIVGDYGTSVLSWVEGRTPLDVEYLPEGPAVNDKYWDSLNAVLISPVSVDGKVLSFRWIQEVVDKAKQNSIPVIFDESRAGFGRFGTYWSQQAIKVDADLTVIGGPAGGGLNLGVVIGPSSLLSNSKNSIFTPERTPLACSAGANTLRAINPGVVAHVEDSSEAISLALGELVRDYPQYLLGTDGFGLWRVLRFLNSDVATDFVLKCRENGLLLNPPRRNDASVLVVPNLIASTEELIRGVGLMGEVLHEREEREVVT